MCSLPAHLSHWVESALFAPGPGLYLAETLALLMFTVCILTIWEDQQPETRSEIADEISP